jgi:hypothetical protein
MADPERTQRQDPDDKQWLTRQNQRIADAEQRASTLTGLELKKQLQRVAALKRALTLGPARLKLATRSCSSDPH